MKKINFHASLVGSMMLVSSCQKKLEQEIAHNLPTTIFLNKAKEQDCTLFKTNLQLLRAGQPILDTAGGSLIKKIGLPEPDTKDACCNCISQTYNAAEVFSEQAAMNPAAGVATVGTLWHMNSIADGSYQQLIAPKRKPMVISIDIPFATYPVDTVKNPDGIGAVRKSINNLLLNNVFTATPVDANQTMETVYSYEHAAMKSQISVSGWGQNLRASFNFEDKSIKSRLIVKFIQKYYTINVDAPVDGACGFFEELPDLSNLDAPPVYVSSVTYGRMAYLFIESSSSEHELKLAIGATINAYGGSGKADISKEQQSLLEKSSIRGYVLGGNGNTGMQALTGFAGFKNHVSQGGSFSKESPGSPISYVLSYLDNGKVANVKLSSTYVVRDCQPKSNTEMVFKPVNKGSYSKMFYDLTEYFAWGPLQKPEFCPNLNCSDGEFNGHGPIVEGFVKLFPQQTHQGTEIWADFQFSFIESNYDTHAYVRNSAKLFILPIDKQFVGFASQPVANLLQYIDNGIKPARNLPMDGDIVEDCIINGDTGGGDVPCNDVGGDMSWIAIKFKPIRILVR
jgi:Thiol-activated cytolysin